MIEHSTDIMISTTEEYSTMETMEYSMVGQNMLVFFLDIAICATAIEYSLVAHIARLGEFHSCVMEPG